MPRLSIDFPPRRTYNFNQTMSVKKFLKDFINVGTGGRKSGGAKKVASEPDKASYLRDFLTVGTGGRKSGGEREVELEPESSLPPDALKQLQDFLGKPEPESEPPVTEIAGSMYNPWSAIMAIPEMGKRAVDLGETASDIKDNVYDTFFNTKVNPKASIFDASEPIFIPKNNDALKDKLLSSEPQVKYEPAPTLENTQGVGVGARAGFGKGQLTGSQSDQVEEKYRADLEKAESLTGKEKDLAIYDAEKAKRSMISGFRGSNTVVARPSNTMARANTVTGGQGVNIGGEVNISGGDQPQDIRTTNLPPNPAAKKEGMMSAVDKVRNKFEEAFGFDQGTSATDGIDYATKPAENYGEDPMGGEAGTFGSEGYDLPYKVKRSAAERVKINRKERGEAAEEFRKKENYDAFFENSKKTLGTTAKGLGVNKGQASLYAPNRGLRKAKKLVDAGFPKAGSMVAADWAASPESDSPIMNKAMRDRLLNSAEEAEKKRRSNSRLEQMMMEQTRMKMMEEINKGAGSNEGVGNPTASLNRGSFSPQTGRNSFFPTRMKVNSSQLSV